MLSSSIPIVRADALTATLNALLRAQSQANPYGELSASNVEDVEFEVEAETEAETVVAEQDGKAKESEQSNGAR